MIETAHGVGLRTTATIMFGHVERPGHWARHLLRIRDLQERTGGFTEFVPLPFVHMEAPIYLQGPRAQGADLARSAADACGRAACAASADPEHPGVLGEARRRRRRAGAARRRERSRRHADERKHLARRRHAARAGVAARRDGSTDPACGREPQQRTTLYGAAPAERARRSFRARPIAADRADAASPARTAPPRVA